MAEKLNLENINNERPEGWGLFGEEEAAKTTDAGQETQETPAENETGNNENQTEQPAEVTVDPAHLFDDYEVEEQQEQQEPESVGGKNKQGQGEPPTETGGDNGSSPSLYSSFADAMWKDGVLKHLDEDGVAAITDADTFEEAMEREMLGRMDATERSLVEAMYAGAQMDRIGQIKDAMDYYDKVKVEDLDNDSDEAIAQFRKDTIATYYMALGLDEKQAQREVQKSINANTDIEDAKAAVEFLRKDLHAKFDAEVNGAKQREEQRQQQQQQRIQASYNRMINSEEPVKGIRVDKRVRQRAFDNAFSPTERINDDVVMTKLQRYQLEHPDEFTETVSILWTLTDGFTNFEKIASGLVRQEKNKNIKELEKVLRSQPGSGAGLRYVGNGRSDDGKNAGPRYRINV